MSETVSLMTRASVPIELLEENPRNVRPNLRLTDWLVQSVEHNGIKVPLCVLATDHGTYMVLMGHRRLAAAKLAKRDEIPIYILDPSLREAGEEFIDQLIENDERGREPLTPLEQADALFQAELAGIPRAKLAQRTGRTKAEVEQSVTAAKTVGASTRAALSEENAYEWTTDVLSVLGEFDDDPAAVERLIAAHTGGYFTHQTTREREDRTRIQARDARRAELAAATVTLIEDTDDLPASTEWLEDLRGTDGQPIDPQNHAGCPGHLAVWDENSDDPDAVEFLCADPAAHGHNTPADDTPEEDHQEEDQDSEQQLTAPTVTKPVREEMPYKLKIEGNAAYRAAGKTRRAWLKEEFLPRKTAPKGLPAFVTAQLLVCPKAVESWTGDVSRVALLAELLGQENSGGAAARAEWIPGNATTGRLMLLNFAVLAACYEKRMDQVQTWRHDKPGWDTEDIRTDARVYLVFLGEMGYPLSPIEQAVITGEPYTLPESEGAVQDPEGEEADLTA